MSSFKQRVEVISNEYSTSSWTSFRFLWLFLVCVAFQASIEVVHIVEVRKFVINWYSYLRLSFHYYLSITKWFYVYVHIIDKSKEHTLCENMNHVWMLVSITLVIGWVIDLCHSNKLSAVENYYINVIIFLVVGLIYVIPHRVFGRDGFLSDTSFLTGDYSGTTFISFSPWVAYWWEFSFVDIIIPYSQVNTSVRKHGPNHSIQSKVKK